MIFENVASEIIAQLRDDKRSPEDPIVRIKSQDDATAWVTLPEVERFGYQLDPDQTCEHHEGVITYGQVITGEAPWITLAEHNRTEAEQLAHEKWHRPREAAAFIAFLVAWRQQHDEETVYYNK